MRAFTKNKGLLEAIAKRDENEGITKNKGLLEAIAKREHGGPMSSNVRV